MESILEFLGTSGIIIIGAIFIVVGYIGSIAPALPGPPIALLSVLLVHFTGFYEYSWITLSMAVFLALIISLADYIIPILGTKKYGGSKSGVRGSTFGLLFGVILGFLIPPIAIVSLIFGPFIGAYIGEKVYAKQTNQVALRSAWGSLVGFLAGTLSKILVTFIISIIFVIGVFKHF